MIKCATCGKENADSFNFCLDCGANLRSSPRASASSSSNLSADVASRLAPTIVPIPLVPAGNVVEAVVQAQAAAAASAAAYAIAPTHISTPIVTIRACPACGAVVPPNYSFCGECGTRMGETDERKRGAIPKLAGIAPTTRTAARLVLIRPDGSEGMTFTLKADETFAGRTTGVILFPDDVFVSPKHARFFYRDDKLFVEDLGSLNGVFHKLRNECELRHGNTIRLGRQLLRLEPLPDALPATNPTVEAGGSDGTKFWGSPEIAYEARLVQLLEGGGSGEVFALKVGENVIGRDSGDITFPTDGFVSSRHASLSTSKDGTKIRDLGSSNGTFLRLEGATALEHGDFLLLGLQLVRIDLR